VLLTEICIGREELFSHGNDGVGCSWGSRAAKIGPKLTIFCILVATTQGLPRHNAGPLESSIHSDQGNGREPLHMFLILGPHLIKFSIHGRELLLPMGLRQSTKSAGFSGASQGPNP
jgi:hypothetical protein